METERLTRTEFEVMEALWEGEKFMTANMVLNQLENTKNWKIQTLISLLNRIVEKGYIATEKRGRERVFQATISREEYLKLETKDFLKHYYNNSYKELISSLISDEDNDVLDQLLQLIKERKMDGEYK